MDFYNGHLCKSAFRSAAVFGFEASGVQTHFRGKLRVALKFRTSSAVKNQTLISMSRKVVLCS